MTEEVKTEKSEESEFDQLLAEWNNNKESKAQEQKVNEEKVDKELVDYVRAEKQKTEKVSMDGAISSAVSLMKEDEKLNDMADPFLEGYLHFYAGKNPSFMDAFQERESNPSKWTQAMDLVTASAVKVVNATPDSKLTKGVESARAAAQGSSEGEKAEDDPTGTKLSAKIDKMSDQEFREFKEGLEAAA